MTSAERCPQCGAALIPGAPLGLCPACLLKAGLAAPTDGPPVGTAGGDGEAPTTCEARPVSEPAHGGGVGSPDHVGPYHIQGVLGEGGMGIVYLAEQREPIARRVALKLVKPGMDSREVLRRFEAERQALALMDHPHIARVLDAGIGPGGTPYFVMEYVPGLTITDYCDRHRLTNAERLELFLPVCAAIQHAHQKGVIHRDLKPSNILVAVQDGKPVPKVIDFGIAKATHQGVVERAAFTELGMLIGTPEYMSPEQAEASGLEVDTTTDIYSLGVILYELLVGALPFDPVALRQAGITEIHRIIREQDPPKPSTRASTLGATAEDVAKRHQTNPGGLARQVRGDLDAITMKALEKDRTRRYASASEFAADLTRYLRGEAVVARPASVAYRTRKFVRRHKVGVAAGALVIATLLVGLFVSMAMYAQAQSARREAESQRALADRQSYFANLGAADLLLRSNQTTEARRRLAETAPRLRGWEWSHLYAKADASLATIGSGGGPTRSVSFSPDGARIVWVTSGGVLHATDAATHKSIHEFQRPRDMSDTEPEFVLATTGDGSRYISTPWRPDVKARIDTAGGRAVIRAFAAGFPIEAGRTLLVKDQASDTAIARLVLPTVGVSQSFDASLVAGIFMDTPDVTARWVRTIFSKMGSSSAVSAAFSLDGCRVVTWSWDNVVQVWDIGTGKPIGPPQGHRDGVAHVTFSPDGTRLASASWDGSVRMWRIGSAVPQMTLAAHQGEAASVAFSRDGTQLASSGADKTIRLWDSGGRLVTTLAGHEATVNAVAFSPDGTHLASGSKDKTVRIWDTAAGQCVAVLLGHTGAVTSVGFSADGSQIVSGSADATVRVWPAGRQRLDVARREADSTLSLAVSLDLQRVASGSYDGAVQLWNVDPRTPVATFTGHTVEVNSLAFARDGTRLASGARDGTVRLWPLTLGSRPLVLNADGQAATALAFSPDGSRLASGSVDGTIRLWDAVSGGLVRSLRQTGWIRTLAYSADGTRIAASAGNSVNIWDVAEGHVVCRTARHEDEIDSVAFSPDGRRVASASRDRTIRIWDSASGKLTTTLIGHDGEVLAVTFDPTGTRIASGSGDGSVRIWDAASGRAFLVLAAEMPLVSFVAFTSDGARLVAASRDGLRIFGSRSAYRSDVVDLVDRLFSNHHLAAAVIDDLRNAAVDSSFRQAAVQIAETRGNDASALAREARRLVAAPGNSPDDYRRGLQLAQAAVGLVPFNQEFLGTLGVAFYRTGRHSEALAILERATALERQPGTIELAFSAMACHRLGDEEQMRSFLAQLRDHMKDAGSRGEQEGAWLAEAEALVAGKTASPARK